MDRRSFMKTLTALAVIQPDMLEAAAAQVQQAGPDDFGITVVLLDIHGNEIAVLPVREINEDVVWENIGDHPVVIARLAMRIRIDGFGEYRREIGGSWGGWVVHSRDTITVGPGGGPWIY